MATITTSQPLRTTVVLYDASGNTLELAQAAPQATRDQAGADLSRLILAELRGIRAALVAIACEGGRAKPDDFEPSALGVGDADVVQ